MAQDEYGNWQPDEEQQYPQQQQQQPQQQYDTSQVGQNNTGVAGPPPQAAPAAPQANPFDYEGFRTGWLTAGFGKKTSADELAQHAAKWGVTIRGGDKAYDPQGNYLGDLIGDIGGRSTLQFLRGPEGHATADRLAGRKGSGKGPISPPGPGNLPRGGGGGGGGAGGGGGTGGGGGGTPPRSGAWDELYNQLMQRSQQGLNIDPNDPVIKAQTDAFRSEGTAQRRNFLASQAERGGPYGNLRSEERRSSEDLAKSVGGLQAQLMGKELDARRQEIQNALSQRESMLTDEQRRALQLELAKINDATQRYGIDVGASTARRGQDFGWREAQLNDATRRYGINTEDQQFRDRLGFDYGDRSNYWDAINRGLLG